MKLVSLWIQCCWYLMIWFTFKTIYRNFCFFCLMSCRSKSKNKSKMSHVEKDWTFCRKCLHDALLWSKGIFKEWKLKTFKWKLKTYTSRFYKIPCSSRTTDFTLLGHYWHITWMRWCDDVDEHLFEFFWWIIWVFISFLMVFFITEPLPFRFFYTFLLPFIPL